MMFSRRSRRALVLMEVVFFVKPYQVCHLTKHMHKRLVPSIVSSKGNNFFMMWLASRL